MAKLLANNVFNNAISVVYVTTMKWEKLYVKTSSESSGVTRVPCARGQKGILRPCFHSEFCTDYKYDSKIWCFIQVANELRFGKEQRTEQKFISLLITNDTCLLSSQSSVHFQRFLCDASVYRHAASPSAIFNNFNLLFSICWLPCTEDFLFPSKHVVHF